MANEMLMHDIGISSQGVMHGATDLLRANARQGTTLVLKMAHFAELYDTTIEMNAAGGLYGHVHATLGCCIDNTRDYEYISYASDTLRKQGEQWGMVNAPVVEDGHMAPTDLPGMERRVGHRSVSVAHRSADLTHEIRLRNNPRHRVGAGTTNRITVGPNPATARIIERPS